MIYTLTVNPALDYNIYADTLTLGAVNRTSEEEITFGGKGINVSFVLKELGIYSTALGFAGGFTGNELLQRLCKCNIITDFVILKRGLTRVNVKLHTGIDTDINAVGPMIDAAAAEKLYRKIEKIKNGDIVCLSGTIPKNAPDISYEEIIRSASGKDIKFVVDAEGAALMSTLKYKPFLIKPNREELGAALGISIDSTEKAAICAKKAQEMGALNVLVSMGADGALLLCEDGRCLYAKAPEGKTVNSVGAGDSMVAGFLSVVSDGGSLEDALKTGVAAGSATAFTKGLATSDEIKALTQQVKVDEMKF